MRNKKTVTENRERNLRAVPTPVSVDEAAEIAMAHIDKLGARPLPRAAWRELLEEIIAQCRTRIEASHADDRLGQ